MSEWLNSWLVSFLMAAIPVSVADHKAVFPDILPVLSISDELSAWWMLFPAQGSIHSCT